MIYSKPYTATIDIDRTPTEFAGDDVDQFSSLVELDRPYRKLLITFPAITSSITEIHLQDGDSTDTVPLAFHEIMSDDGATQVWATTASAGSLVIQADIGFVQFFRLRCTTNQTADRAITVRGMD